MLFSNTLNRRSRICSLWRDVACKEEYVYTLQYFLMARQKYISTSKPLILIFTVNVLPVGTIRPIEPESYSEIETRCHRDPSKHPIWAKSVSKSLNACSCSLLPKEETVNSQYSCTQVGFLSSTSQSVCLFVHSLMPFTDVSMYASRR